MAQYGFYFDSTRCTGCKTCQVTCKETYALPTENLWRKVLNYQGGSWEFSEVSASYQPVDVFGYFISMACNHCMVPACLSVCPTDAIIKEADTGIVWIDGELCIGCDACLTACPYGAPQHIEEEGIVTKCDMCQARVLEGDIPLCVSSCPMRALDFGDVEELKITYGEGDIEIAPLPLNTTYPSMVMKPSKDAQPSGSAVGSTVSLPEELPA